MKTIILSIIVLAVNAFAQQTLTSVAVLPPFEGATLGDDELKALTDEMREAALKVLPTNTFTLLKQDVVVKRLGGAEKYIKECSESSCIVDLGRKAMVDYVAQANVRKLGNKLRITVELHNVRTGGSVDMFNDEADNVRGLLAIVKRRAPEMFVKIKRYLVNITSDPDGANLSFDVESFRCITPCKVELPVGSVHITADLEEYEMADTTIFIKQNNQSVRIRMKPIKYNEKVKYKQKDSLYVPKYQGENNASITNNASNNPALEKCDAIFNSSKKFCYDGKIYDLCDGMPYNPTTHICSDGIANRALCNKVQYNPLIYLCKNNNIVAECGTTIYNPATHGCKDNTVLPKCGAVVYDPATQICKDNNVLSRCGATIYNPATHFCGYNNVFPKCGAVVYDPATQACKGNTLVSRCGTTIYDSATHGCKDNVVLPKCGETVYDPATQACKDYIVLQRCGATEFYNPKIQECRFGAVFKK